MRLDEYMMDLPVGEGQKLQIIRGKNKKSALYEYFKLQQFPRPHEKISRIPNTKQNTHQNQLNYAYSTFRYC